MWIFGKFLGYLSQNIYVCMTNLVDRLLVSIHRFTLAIFSLQLETYVCICIYVVQLSAKDNNKKID